MSEKRIATSKVAGTWAWALQRLTAVLLVVVLGVYVWGGLGSVPLHRGRWVVIQDVLPQDSGHWWGPCGPPRGHRVRPHGGHGDHIPGPPGEVPLGGWPGRGERLTGEQPTG